MPESQVLSQSSEAQKAAAAAVLEWYLAMGVDCALTADPIDWRKRKATPPLPAFDLTATEGAAIEGAASQRDAPSDRQHDPVNRQNASTVPPHAAAGGRFTATQSPGAAASEAREKAKSAKTLDQLEEILRGFDGCALKATAKNLCFYRGSQTAPLAIIGEAPGRDEDIAGKPFVGRAGQLLDKMLSSIGCDESNVHITNVVYWRPPGNRTPTPLEAQICRPFLMRQLELLNPEMVLVLGGAAAKNILDVSDSIMRVRGKWRTLKIAERDVPVMASLHPAYLLRTPAAKRLAWRDLLAVKAAQKTT